MGDIDKPAKNPTKWSKAVEPILSQTLKIHPACLEFAPANISSLACPSTIRNYVSEYFVVGTYSLTEEDKNPDEEKPTDEGHQKRVGGVSLFRLQGHKPPWQEDMFYEYGIYDLKFLPYHPIFAASTTVGKIVIFELEETKLEEEGQRNLQMKEVASHQIFEDTTIIISITWFPLPHPSDRTRVLAITVEDGGVFLIRFTDNFKLYDILNHGSPLHEHIYKTPYFENPERVWCCAISTPIPNRVFSGGDDNFLRVSTLNVLSTKPENIQDSKNVRITQDDLMDVKFGLPAGVTSILPLPIIHSHNTSSPSYLLVGSYDCHIRLIMMTDGLGASTSEDGTPLTAGFTELLSIDLGGGVYRLKFLEPYLVVQNEIEASFKVLACCMHAGAKILEVKRSMNRMPEKRSVNGISEIGAVNGTWEISVLAEVKDNESMCYAAGVQPLPASRDGEFRSGDEERICVSSSWADSKLSVWRFVAGLV